MTDIAIKVEGIGKKYRIGQKKSGELRETFGNFFRSFKPTANSQQPTANKEFWALKDISFEVRQGEAVGIIGRNGAGKSTLLKILSRITKPTTGRFEINGRVSSLLEVGTGFHPELTGRENIYLNGTILGMRRAEIKAKFDEILAFSGVEEFIDTPVKHYSSGMKVRLAFSVAAHLEPEILIIDEVLAVGDAEFQKKCLGKMEDVTGQGRTVLFVSHNMDAIRKLCNHGMLISAGIINNFGRIEEIMKDYLFSSNSKDYYLTEKKKVSGIQIINAKLNFQEDVNPFLIYFEIVIYSDVELQVSIDLRITDVTQTPVAFSSLGTFDPGELIRIGKGENYVKIETTLPHLATGSYNISIDLTEPDIKYHERLENCLGLELVGFAERNLRRNLSSSWKYGNIKLISKLIDIGNN